jgi:hypothetical protein
MKRADFPEEDKRGCLFVLGPYIPCFPNGYGVRESLYAYIQKNGKTSKMMNEDELEILNDPRIIYIDEADEQYLKLITNEKVLVWFFIGDSYLGI